MEGQSRGVAREESPQAGILCFYLRKYRVSSVYACTKVRIFSQGPTEIRGLCLLGSRSYHPIRKETLKYLKTLTNAAINQVFRNSKMKYTTHKLRGREKIMWEFATP